MWCQIKKIAVSSVKNQEISHKTVFTLGAISATNMVTLSWTAHTEYLLQGLLQQITNHTSVTMPDQVQGTTMRIETDEADPDHSPSLQDIIAWAIVINIETTLDHNTGIDTATTGAAHDDLIQPTENTTTDLAMTLHTSHITDHPNIKALQVIDPEITVDHIYNHPIVMYGSARCE